jgi:hypothetical protein
MDRRHVARVIVLIILCGALIAAIRYMPAAGSGARVARDAGVYALDPPVIVYRADPGLRKRVDAIERRLSALEGRE